MKSIYGTYKIKYHPDGLDSTTEAVEIDFTPPFKRISMFPALEEVLSVKLPSPTELSSSEVNKLLDDLCVKHNVECPLPRTSARLLDKVRLNTHISIYKYEQ